MRYTTEQIEKNLMEWLAVSEDYKPYVSEVIAFCHGYYGAITQQIWEVIKEFIKAGYIRNEVL